LMLIQSVLSLFSTSGITRKDGTRTDDWQWLGSCFCFGLIATADAREGIDQGTLCGGGRGRPKPAATASHSPTISERHGSQPDSSRAARRCSSR
jgi:hypothetical protein